MANKDNVGEKGVPACFFFANSIPKNISGFKVCQACEVATGPGGIEGGQRLFGLWRIYCSTTKARNDLLKKGITIDDQYIPLVGVNPKVVKGANDSPSVKLIIGNIAKSVSNEDIVKSLSELDGVKIRSKMFDEHYRDDHGKLSLFKSGRRFLYIDTPPKPLPTQFQVGKWTPSLYHYGQKPKVDNKDKTVTTGNDQGENISPENVPVATSQEEKDYQQSQNSSNVNSGKQTNINNFFNSPSIVNPTSSRQSRPKSRIPSKKSRTLSDSASRKRGLIVTDFQIPPSRKSQRPSIDYFDFTPQYAAESSETGDGSVD